MTIEISNNNLILLTATVAGLLIVYLIVRLSLSEKRKNEAVDKFRELEGKINKLELQTLESKLNPHLFKNILNSIQSHAYQTYFALDKLANVLDYILYESRKKFVTPKDEIEFALNLIEINKIKISPLFQVGSENQSQRNRTFVRTKIARPFNLCGLD